MYISLTDLGREKSPIRSLFIFVLLKNDSPARGYINLLVWPLAGDWIGLHNVKGRNS
jgi:hypothetical protein